MNINQRIKELRKQLRYNQKDFGKKIGIGQAGVSWIEQDGNTVTDQNIRIICDAFNVSERWLRTGEGPQQRETREALLDKLAEQYSLSPDGVDIIRAVLSLSPSEWDAAVGIIRSLANSLAGDHIDDADKMATIEKSSTVAPTNEDSSTVDREAARAAAHRQLNLELDAQEKGSSSTYANTEKRA